MENTSYDGRYDIVDPTYIPDDLSDIQEEYYNGYNGAYDIVDPSYVPNDLQNDW